MDQPTREEFEDHEQRIRKLEQQTEPIKVTRIELDSSGVLEHMSQTNKLLKGMTEMLPDHGEKLDTLTRGQQEIKQDIKAIHDVFVGDFDRIETAMATKDDITRLETTTNALKTTQDEHGQLLSEHSQMLKQILQLLQPKPGE